MTSAVLWSRRSSCRLCGKRNKRKIENEEEMSVQQPSVNRAVHYVSAGSADGKYPSVCRAATITEVGTADKVAQVEERVCLMVINPTGVHFRPLSEGGANYASSDDGLVPYTWHWPERV